ncbi:hypothetical protein CPB86DRAFT_875902 [Serendipita vermifera]|nr:hypothetical protein CPB86DRAFT_875902 [Serendipita vermifera]
MSTNWQYAPVSSQDADSVSRTHQSDTRESVDSLEDKHKKYQNNREDDLKSQESTIQMLTNVNVSDIIEVPNWPGPKTLEVTRGQSILHSMGYILLLVPPLVFLVLVLSAIGLHSKEVSPFGAIVSQACLLGPTVFPIAFSAILGWCLRTYGCYKSERGVKLGQLERVIGSQTLFSFLKFAFKFKQIDRLCIILAMLWVLSPLGGQGVLRMLSMRQLIETREETVTYLDLYGRSRYFNTKSTQLARRAVEGLYLASLFAPVEIKNRTTDLWGGIKIPSIEFLDFDHQDDDGVVVGDVSNYTSLLGIPVNSTAFTATSNYTFTLNTTVFTTRCEEPQVFGRDDVGYPSYTKPFYLETQPIPGTATERGVSLITYPFELNGGVVNNCTITPNFLLAKVECYSGHCGVSRIKRVVDPDGQLAHAILGRNKNTWPNIVERLPETSGISELWVSSQTERYLYDPQAPQAENSGLSADLREIPVDEFSRRFAILLNTYYQATVSPAPRLNSLIRDVKYPNDSLKTTVATIRTLSPNTYQRHWEWVISALVASLAMFSVAIIGILLERRVISPDIYGYVSSMTRDNPYFPLPPNGCTLEGTERAVLLRDVVVRIEDVAPTKQIGHLAFTMAGYKTPTEQPIDCRLRRTKVYSGS